MKKGIIIVIATLTLALSFSNAYYELFSGSFASQEESSAENNSNDVIVAADDTQQTGIVYLNEDMDFYIVINESGWTYQSDGYLVSFFDNSSDMVYGTFSFLSVIITATDSEKDAKASEYYESAKENLNSMFKSITFEQADKYCFGQFCAYRHHFEGEFDEGDMATIENLYWWVGDRQYTCSLFCDSAKYDEFAEILYSALETFSPASLLS
ncbi:MAG: hypothetical protein JXN65_09480 [Clostridia bacterium]|nr:hypothetical protein [Clostridia bacterium]